MSVDERLYEEEPCDLSSCDPQGDPDRFERLVGDIRRAATAELLRRQAALGLWGQFWRWRLPIFAGSALLMLGAMAILLTQQPRSAPRSLIAEASGVPSAWLYGSAGNEDGLALPVQGEQR